MSGTNLMGSYFGSGLLAARPAAPLVPAGASAVYAATDNGHIYMWSGAAWKTIL